MSKKNKPLRLPWITDRDPEEFDTAHGHIFKWNHNINALVTCLWGTYIHSQPKLKTGWLPGHFFAGPAECEARKADQEAKEILKDDNPWIPGRNPEKEGKYEVTVFKNGEYKTEHYWLYKNQWQTYHPFYGCQILDNAICITAHRPITLSDPYQPSKRKRELLCPFCESKDCQLYEHNEFQCQKCGAILHETEERILEIYNKLNEAK